MLNNKDFKYIEKGEIGRTCAECKYYEASTTEIGRCFGYEVHPWGSCDSFERDFKKDSTVPAELDFYSHEPEKGDTDGKLQGGK